MRPHTSPILLVTLGISVLCGVWLMFITFQTGWLRDAPGYPFSVIIPGAWMVLAYLGWSLNSLFRATGVRRIPSILKVIAASLFAVGMSLLLYNLLTFSSDATTSPTVSVWLIPSAIIGALILSQVGSLLELGWGKTNLHAWLRVIGAACIGGILLFGFLLLWSTWR